MQPGANVEASNPAKSVARVLQHSILQLCNEHIGYNHTLQVLGVLCMTIDDQPHELVVKVNNTLKRVNAVTPPKDAATHHPPPGILPRQVDTCCSGSVVLPPSTTTAITSYENGGRAAVERIREPRCPDLLSSPSNGCGGGADARKGHGRKQTNPIRVKHVFDAADEDISDDGGNVITIEPTRPPDSPDNDDGGGGGGGEREPASKMTSMMRSTPKRLGGMHHVKRKLSELFGSPTSRGSSGIDGGGRGNVKASLDLQMSSGRNVPSKNASNDTTPKSSLTLCDGDDDSKDSDCGRRLAVVEPEDDYVDAGATEEDRKEATTTTEGGGALNLSMCALNGGVGSGQLDKSDGVGGGGTGAFGGLGGVLGGGGGGGVGALAVACLQNDAVNGIRIKEEMQSFYPVDLNFIMNANGFDVSQNVAVRASFLDDHRRFLPTVQSSLANDLGSTSSLGLRYLGDGSTAGGLLLDETQLRNMVNGLSAQVAASSSYTISNRLNDGLTMQLTRKRMLTKDRSSMKVKDIIMYDDSAPLHTQRGSRIEGDFMLDALNVGGKKRRRRTAEDALTAEEIAEYMGCSVDRTASAPACAFRCRCCGELCADLSRYFSHTLVRHNSFVCHQCGKSFTTKSSLLRHRPIHTGMRRFACSICRKSFYRKDKCKAHIKRHLGVVGGGSDATPAADKYPQIKIGSA